MDTLVEINAGECGFYANAKACCEDGQHVSFLVDSNCEKICKLGRVLRHAEPVDAYVEIASGPKGRLLAVCSEILPGCCSGCIVPAALVRAMRVAAGLSLPRDVAIHFHNP